MAKPTYTHDDPVVAGFKISEALDDLARLADRIEEATAIIEEETNEMYREAVARAPRSRLGRYVTAIRKKIFRNAGRDGVPDVVGTVFVIQLPWIRNLKWQRRSNPNGTKLWPKNLPIWLEYGTYKMSDRPHLNPAFEAARRRVNARLERLLNEVAS